GAVERGRGRREYEAAQPQEPRVAPPQRLRLAPASIEQDNPLDPGERRLLVGDDLARGIERAQRAFPSLDHRARRTEVKDGPAPWVGRGTERGVEPRPGESDGKARTAELALCQDGAAERPVTLLRVLEDQEKDAVRDRRQRRADAERTRLAAVGAEPSGARQWLSPRVYRWRVEGDDATPSFRRRRPVRELGPEAADDRQRLLELA